MLPRSNTPAALGYRWPAEWEPHAATWLSWPRNRDSWPGKFEPVPGIFAKMVAEIARHEPVHINAGRPEVMEEAKRLVGHLSNVTLHDIPTNDAWCRDHGPMFLVPPPGLPPALIDWEYNAWGGKYPPFDFDNAVPGHVAQYLGMKRYSPGIILEGGSVDGNGRGTILTTRSCLLNPNRNADLSQAEVEQYLADYCGAKKVLWLEGHFAGDDTDGHIDQLARFVGPRTVFTIRQDDPRDENHEPLADSLRRLESMTDQDGRPLEVVSVPLPAPKYHDGQRLPAGYCNFYIANGLVLVPTFRDPADQMAIETLARLMPDRKVVGLDSLDLIWGLGSFHCLSQQQPRMS